MLVVIQMDVDIVTLLAELHEHGDEMIVEKAVAVVVKQMTNVNF